MLGTVTHHPGLFVTYHSGSNPPRFHQPLLHDPDLQTTPNEFQLAPLFHLSRYLSHQHVVVYPVKELFQIKVHHPAFAGLNVTRCRFDRLCRTASGPKPITVR